MILYHGTNTDFQQIRLDMSRVGKDFGFGFYLTTDKQVAARQAERKVLQYGIGAKIVQSYAMDEKQLDGLKVLRFDSYTEEWADFILMNRQNKEHRSLHDYDVVIGPIANDTVGFQIRRYTEGIITKAQFLQEIMYHQVTMQYFFGTERALAILERQ
ncbi:MAG: DUF3990 domain-containing protein [Paludibacteraceae bacterium]|nr:DUF3990 domain-containing protein [Paludibacteraceae bacterium]